MNQRYTVYEGDDPFASVHASTPEDAIKSACQKVPGHDPGNCTAVCEDRETAEGTSWRTLDSWDDLDWNTFGA